MRSCSSFISILLPSIVVPWLHRGRIAFGNPTSSAKAHRPFKPAENGSGKPLEMIWNQREGLLLGGFP